MVVILHIQQYSPYFLCLNDSLFYLPLQIHNILETIGMQILVYKNGTKSNDFTPDCFC